MLFYVDRVMEIILLPPGNILLLVILGCIFWNTRPRVGKFVIAFALASLWLLSTPIIAQHLLDPLQYSYPVLIHRKLNDNQNAAIVVLEAGLNSKAPEYGEPTVSEGTLVRLRYAALLYQKIKAPVLVSGNDPNHQDINQADYMAKALNEYFNVPTQWKEDRGYTTAQEGLLSNRILKKAGIKKIYLVTHALHMPRSVYSFHQDDIEVVPAPTGFITIDYHLGRISGFLPTCSALTISYIALREYVGLLWYHIYYRF